MIGARPAALALGVAAVVVLVLAVIGTEPGRYAAAPANERTPQRPVPISAMPPPDRTGAPPEVAAAAGAWPLPHHDYANSRATDTARIDAANVGRLGVAWTLRLGAHSHWGAAASAPVIANRVVYFQDLSSDVWALDEQTGAVRWRTPISLDAFGPNGPSIGWGKVFAQDGRRSLWALDSRNGAALWKRRLAGPTGSQQPIPFGGMIFTGLSSGAEYRNAAHKLKMHLLEPGSSGWIYGLRQDNGGVVWAFRTVERGFWGHPEVNSGGGIWYAPAVDPSSGMTYWSSGNPAPGPGTAAWPNGSSRRGPNRWSNTAFAFDGRTGHPRWIRQLLRHDLFHHDLQNPPMLVRA
jgi:glucose dehydrogenase